jgi:hypothetical protein
VRKAQGYAIGVHGDSSTFNSGFGVHFSTNTDISNLAAGSQKSFVIFRDINNDHQYTVNESIELLKITNASKILNIIDSLPHTIDNEDIIFIRPNPEPIFYNSGTKLSGIPSVVIKVGDGYGADKFITIYNNGQISVN